MSDLTEGEGGVTSELSPENSSELEECTAESQSTSTNCNPFIIGDNFY